MNLEKNLSIDFFLKLNHDFRRAISNKLEYLTNERITYEIVYLIMTNESEVLIR